MLKDSQYINLLFDNEVNFIGEMEDKDLGRIYNVNCLGNNPGL